jgi:hypothetical protein
MGSPDAKRNRWKIAFFVLTVMLAGALGIAGYSLLNQAVTLTYMGKGYEDTVDDLRVFMKLFPEVSRSMSRQDFVFLLRKQNPDALITDDTEGVGIGFLRFEFDQKGKLTRVKHALHSEEIRETK